MFDLNRLLNAFRLGAPADFQRMLDWKLLRGSHEFPGPDGGTCINEAAIVAAGYPYRAVYCVKDLPASFSRPISMLALCLNDTLDDTLRQELLLPFVTRLGGSADTPQVEMTRAELILDRTVNEVLAPALARAGHAELAERYRARNTPTELVAVAKRMRQDFMQQDFMQQDRTKSAALREPLVAAVEHAADAGRQWLAGLPTEVVFCAFSAMREIAALERERSLEKVYRRAVTILDAALEVGNRAGAIGGDVVAQRMQVAKENAEEALAA